MENSLKTGRRLLVICIITVIMASIIITSVNGQTYYVVFFDSFDDYVEKIYSGTNGPGMWYQSVGGGGTAEYKVVVSGTTKYYDLKSTGGVFVKSILAYYLFGVYVGPNDYYIESSMKVVSGEGGLIFRISPDFKKYYLATIYKTSKKLVLWYVNEDEGPGAGPVLGQANIPDTVDVGNWFSLRVTIYKNNITVVVNNNKLLSILDNRLSSGGVGLYTYKNGEASFDSFLFTVLAITETTTTTKTVTSPTTTTKTITTLSYLPTTITGGEITLTKTETLMTTTTIPITTLLETTITQPSTVIVTEAVTTIKTESVEIIRTVPGPTETVTTTVTQGLGFKCLIATAAYGSEVAPQVQALREFRDEFVMKTFAGSNFMTVFNVFYYSWSPYISEAEYRNPTLRSTIKLMIYPLVSLLEFSRSVSAIFSAFPEFAILISGLIASSLIGLIYLTPLALIIYLILKIGKINVKVNLTYLHILFGVSLLLFLVAEFSSSSILMMISSSMIVLSMTALTIAFSVRIFSAIGKMILNFKKLSK